MSNLYKKANRRYNETWSAYIICVTFAWISSIDCAVYLWPGLSLPYCLLYYVYDELKANGDMCSEGETIEKSTSIAFICVSMAVTIRRTCSLAAHGSVCMCVGVPEGQRVREWVCFSGFRLEVRQLTFSFFRLNMRSEQDRNCLFTLHLYPPLCGSLRCLGLHPYPLSLLCIPHLSLWKDMKICFFFWDSMLTSTFKKKKKKTQLFNKIKSGQILNWLQTAM